MATVLVVDDHPDIREVVAQIFRLHEHNVTFAESGEIAWEQLQSTAPDAVIVDQRLPGMTGIALLTRIRQTPAMSAVEVIVCSGDDSEREAAEIAGARDFWVKGSSKIFDAIEAMAQRLKND